MVAVMNTVVVHRPVACFRELHQLCVWTKQLAALELLCLTYRDDVHYHAEKQQKTMVW